MTLATGIKKKEMSSIGTGNDSIIIGLGKTGISCARFLAARGEQFTVVDNRARPPEHDRFIQEFPQVQVRLGEFEAEMFMSARRLIISPGVAPFHPAIREAVAGGVELIGDIELFARNANAPIIAVTGSNGKSTVAALVAAMVAAAGYEVCLGGNFGTPALSFLDRPPPDFYVLELSSFQLETVSSLDALAAVVLNVSVDHMDRYPDLEIYALAKQRIYAGSGCMIINRDDRRVAGMLRPGRKITGFTLSRPEAGDFGLVRTDGIDWLCHGTSRLVPASSMLLQGRHNIANALAALALGHAAGLPYEPMIDTLKSFSGLPHRCEWVADSGGVTWINDSKGTNPGATCAAIEGLANGSDLVLIAGGDGKGADFTALGDSVAGRVRATVLIGRDADKIAAVLEGRTEIHYATDMRSAVTTAAKVAHPGDKVLLSPACASFDMFRDYQDRGHQYIEAVITYIKGAGG